MDEASIRRIVMECLEAYLGPPLQEDSSKYATWAREVYAYWRSKMVGVNPSSRARSAPDPKALRSTIARLREARAAGENPVEYLKSAVDGLFMSPYHLGQNVNGKQYLGYDLVVRAADRPVKLISLAERALQQGNQDSLEDDDSLPF